MPPKEEKNDEDPSHSSFHRQSQRLRGFLSIPPAIKTLFDKFPIVTYATNELPQRAPKPSRIPNLYVFSTDEDVAAGKPSFNPSCLKWQVRKFGKRPLGGETLFLTIE
jgi:metaxin